MTEPPNPSDTPAATIKTPRRFRIALWLSSRDDKILHRAFGIPLDPQPVLFVEQSIVAKGEGRELLPPEALRLCDGFEYRGGYIECWIEVESEGKKEVVARISTQEMFQHDAATWPYQVPLIHGHIFWEPESAGEDDVALLVTGTFDAPGLGTTKIKVEKGTNHQIKEKWSRLGNIVLTEGSGSQELAVGEEKRILAYKLTGGYLRLMCKFVGVGK
jgi:hypothetical protein